MATSGRLCDNSTICSAKSMPRWATSSGQFAEAGSWSLLLSPPIGIVFGAAHALTPGHSKSVLAAYVTGAPVNVTRRSVCRPRAEACCPPRRSQSARVLGRPPSQGLPRAGRPPDPRTTSSWPLGDDRGQRAKVRKQTAERAARPRPTIAAVIGSMTLIDEFRRKCLAIRVARRINAIGVIETLADAMLLDGVPAFIRSDNGPEMIARVLPQWLSGLGTKSLYIEPGSPWENGTASSPGASSETNCSMARSSTTPGKLRWSSRTGASTTTPEDRIRRFATEDRGHPRTFSARPLKYQMQQLHQSWRKLPRYRTCASSRLSQWPCTCQSSLLAEADRAMAVLRSNALFPPSRENPCRHPAQMPEPVKALLEPITLR